MGSGSGAKRSDGSGEAGKSMGGSGALGNPELREVGSSTEPGGVGIEADAEAISTVLIYC